MAYPWNYGVEEEKSSYNLPATPGPLRAAQTIQQFGSAADGTIPPAPMLSRDLKQMSEGMNKGGTSPALAGPPGVQSNVVMGKVPQSNTYSNVVMGQVPQQAYSNIAMGKVPQSQTYSNVAMGKVPQSQTYSNVVMGQVPRTPELPQTSTGEQIQAQIPVAQNLVDTQSFTQPVNHAATWLKERLAGPNSLIGSYRPQERAVQQQPDSNVINTPEPYMGTGKASPNAPSLGGMLKERLLGPDSLIGSIPSSPPRAIGENVANRLNETTANDLFGFPSTPLRARPPAKVQMDVESGFYAGSQPLPVAQKPKPTNTDSGFYAGSEAPPKTTDWKNQYTQNPNQPQLAQQPVQQPQQQPRGNVPIEANGYRGSVIPVPTPQEMEAGKQDAYNRRVEFYQRLGATPEEARSIVEKGVVPVRKEQAPTLSNAPGGNGQQGQPFRQQVINGTQVSNVTYGPSSHVGYQSRDYNPMTDLRGVAVPNEVPLQVMAKRAMQEPELQNRLDVENLRGGYALQAHDLAGQYNLAAAQERGQTANLIAQQRAQAVANKWQPMSNNGQILGWYNPTTQQQRYTDIGWNSIHANNGGVNGPARDLFMNADTKTKTSYLGTISDPKDLQSYLDLWKRSNPDLAGDIDKAYSERLRQLSGVR